MVLVVVVVVAVVVVVLLLVLPLLLLYLPQCLHRNLHINSQGTVTPVSESYYVICYLLL